MTEILLPNQMLLMYLTVLRSLSKNPNVKMRLRVPRKVLRRKALVLMAAAAMIRIMAQSLILEKVRMIGLLALQWLRVVAVRMKNANAMVYSSTMSSIAIPR